MLQHLHLEPVSLCLLTGQDSCSLNIAVDHEADPLNLAPTSSTTTTMAMGDALACALVHLRNFKPSDFAMFHPGGSLGKRLLTRVKDAMVSTNLPLVTPEHKISDTIIEISKTKLGLSVVMVGDEIAGVVTDGDIRRAMNNHQDRFFELTVSEIMSKFPKTIDENAKLSEAEQIMRTKNIHSLLVVDNLGKLVGIIDAFSCM